MKRLALRLACLWILFGFGLGEVDLIGQALNSKFFTELHEFNQSSDFLATLRYFYRKNENAYDLLVVLGETHVKPADIARTERDIIDRFSIRGTEGFDFDRVPGGSLAKFFVESMMTLIRPVQSLFTLEETSFRYAKQANERIITLIDLERSYEPDIDMIVWILYFDGLMLAILWKGGSWAASQVISKTSLRPRKLGVLDSCGRGLRLVADRASSLLFTHFQVTALAGMALGWLGLSWAWMINPAAVIISDESDMILGRDKAMAQATDEAFSEGQVSGPMITMMGLAHLPGYSQRMIEDYGFTEWLPPLSSSISSPSP